MGARFLDADGARCYKCGIQRKEGCSVGAFIHPSQLTRCWSRTLLACAAAAFVCSCAATPPPSHVDRTRVGTTETTRGDIYSDQASMPDLYRFSDEVGMRLARDIAQIPEIKDSPTRVVIELGSINNETNTSTNDFEMIQRRLFGQVQQSDHLQNYAMVVEKRQFMERDYKEIMGEDDPDLLQEGRSSGGPQKYDPNITYVLQGHFYESRRGATGRYLFGFQLSNLGSRAIVFNRTFDSSHITP